MKTIIVASNKGGTGKTTVSCALARSLAKIAPTALLDTDVTGPNVMTVLDVPYKHAQFDLDKFYPQKVAEQLEAFSPALVIDSPPSTSDELLTVLLQSNPTGVVIVTHGSQTAINDARRLISILENEMFNIPIIGYIHNMTDVFGTKPLDGIELLGDVLTSDTLDVDHIRDKILERLNDDN